MAEHKFTTKDIATPRNGAVLLLRSYWACIDGQPDKAVFWDNVAQCNQHKAVAKRIAANVSEKTGWKIELRFVQMAFRPQTTNQCNAMRW